MFSFLTYSAMPVACKYSIGELGGNDKKKSIGGSVTAAGKEISMGYSKEKVLEEVDETIIALCKGCRNYRGNENTEAIKALTDLIEVRASMPDWKEKLTPE